MKIIKSVDEAKEFIETAQPYSRCIYHVGGGATDTTLSTFIKNVVWNAAVAGKVYLVQKRIGPSQFQYIAIKSRDRLKSLIPNPSSYDYVPRERKTNIYTYDPTKTMTLRQAKALRSSLVERVQDERVG